MKQAFVSIVSSYVGFCVASVLRGHGYGVVGSIRQEDTEDIAALVSQTVDANDETGTARLALSSDIVVLCSIEDIRGADSVLTALQISRNEVGGPSHLLVLSTTMTWAKTKLSSVANTASHTPSTIGSLPRPASMVATSRRTPPGAGNLPRAASVAGGSWTQFRDNARSPGTASSRNSDRGNHSVRGSPAAYRRRHTPADLAMTEDDYLLRQPAIGYLEHKRLEGAALSLQSTSLNVCVVGAGVPYGLGEGPLLRVFRDAWRAGNGSVAMPTCTSGDNRLALVHVVDLSVAVGNLLRPLDHNSPPAPFPKPYILAVDGDGVQCTAKEFTVAVGRAFRGSGETHPIDGKELENVLVDDSAALQLLLDVRFSNDSGVLAEMVASGKLEPVAWSKGFVASAETLAQDFVSTRSLSPIKAVLLGPPGGGQNKVCVEISRRYGMMLVDAKVAADGVFAAAGKCLPEYTTPEERAPPPTKGKKGKDAKKGAVKGEPTPESEAALAALPLPERLLHDIGVAFEAADVPMSDYTTFDAGGLARLLPASLVARSARLLLEGASIRWSRSGYILCDIPSHADAASDVFADPSPTSRPGSRASGSGRSSSSILVPSQPAVGELRPTHVVFLDASADAIVERRREIPGGAKDTETKIIGDLERYFADERKQPEAENVPPETASGQQQVEGDKGDNLDDSYGTRGHWIPATAKALRDDFGAKTKAVDAEEGMAAVVDAVDLHLTGGEVPACVWMLSGDSSDEVDGAEHGVDKNEEGAASGEVVGGAAALAVDDLTPWAEPTEDGHGRSDSTVESAGRSADLSLKEVMAKLTVRDAEDVEIRSRCHRSFLTAGVVPHVAAGLVAAAETRPEDPLEFLAAYLIRAGRALQNKAEAEAALKYQAGLALLKEMEAIDNNRRPVANR